MKNHSPQKIRRALSLTFPVFLGYIPLGVAFGVLLVKAGYPWYLAPIMAVVMYAGSGQLLAVSFFAANSGYAEIAVATALMQLRHAFYGLSLLKYFSSFSRIRFYCIHGLTDETYALLTGIDIADDDREEMFFLITLFDHAYWILGCTIGAVAGSFIPSDMKGLDFALTALFTVLAVEKFTSSDTPVPHLTGAAASVAALLLFGPQNMLLGAIGIAVVILMIYGWKHDDADC